MRMAPGRILLAAGFAGLGGLGIAFHDFAVTWQLVPKTIAWHDMLANISGAILMAGGFALLVPRLARVAALILTALLFLFVLLLRLPPLLAQPLVEANWYGLSETTMLAAGALTIFGGLPHGNRFARPGKARLGPILFALALIPIGLSHFFYVKQTAPLIPSWLPSHVSLAYATGAAHIAAGAGILIGILPRLAARLETLMVGLFTLLIWVPMVMAKPASAFDWSELLLSTAITGAAWAVASALP
jgi:uncharacterized membrane protein